MRLYPAIDIRNGKCVRLRQGRFDELTVYNDNPVDAALEWKRQGAEYIHVVDLDGAKAGDSSNIGVIRKIAEATGLPIQTGGGVRSIENIRERLDAGAARVIIGTKAVKEPEFVEQALLEFGADRIVIGLDGRGEAAAIYGWEQESTSTILELACKFAGMGVGTIVYTDISRDGMLSGPNFDYTKKLITETGIDIIASGGIASSADLNKLERIGAAGAILGKSLYEGRISLEKETAKHRG